MSSKKSITRDSEGKEKETVQQRNTAGVKASVGFFKVLKFSLGIGQNELTTTSKIQDAVDEYGEIDYEKDLNMSTENGDKDVKIKETQRKADVSLIVDPSFWIFILRAKMGATATQRLLEKEELGVETVNFTSPITYKPHAGIGFGTRLGRMAFWMAEYEFFFYKFPETEPFERAVSVSFGVSM